MIGKTNLKSGGGLDINGIIEEYTVASGGNVSAGDFVNFLNEYGTDTSISSNSDDGYSISAVALSENKVFIAHSYSGSYLYGIVCTVDGTTITVGNDTQLSSVDNTGTTISTVALSENKVFIAHKRNDSYYYLYGIVCTVDGTTITAGTDIQLSSVNYSGSTISAVLLSESKVFIAHMYNNNSYLYGIVCTVDGTTITVGNDTQLSSGSSTSSTISAVALSENKVFIAHSYSGNYNLYGIICTINDTTITTGSDTQLSIDNSISSTISAVALTENKVFIAHSYGNSTRYLYGMICNVNNTTITTGTDTLINNDASKNAGYRISAVALSNNKVFIAHSYGTTSYPTMYGATCIVEGTNITVESDVEINSNTYSGLTISTVFFKNKVFIAHSRGGSTYLNGIVINYAIKSISQNNPIIEGVATTSGTAGNTVKVAVPNLS